MRNPFGISALRRGYQIGSPELQFDTVRGRGPAIISHAHSDHAPESRRSPIIASPETAALLRLRGHTAAVTTLDFDVWMQLDDCRIKFLPAGHIIGSTQVLVERPDGLRLLYTGDMKTRRGRAAQPARFEHTDDLIIETTFGLPIFRFPESEEIESALIEFAQRCFERAEIPIFTGYSLGKSQEIMSILASAGIALLVHPSTWQVTQVYEKFGHDFGDVARFAARSRGEQRAWIMPADSAQLRRAYPTAKICYASGWALLESRRASVGATLMAPLSDHADYYDLFDAIRRVEPTRVWTVHGPYAELFARDVARTLNLQASSLAALRIDDQSN